MKTCRNFFNLDLSYKTQYRRKPLRISFNEVGGYVDNMIELNI